MVLFKGKEVMKMVMSKQDKTDYKRKFNEENYIRKTVYLKKEVNDAFEEHRARTGESFNAYVNRLIDEDMKGE